LLQQAEALARKYRIILEPDEDCGYVGSALEMPYALGDGKSADECVKSVIESLTIAVAHLLEQKKTPPAPADQQQRSKQVNIRLTEAEQRRLKELALAHGYTDLSDFVRSTSLQCAT
jgi:predicted RNase H-like HicB family nuclease